MQYVPRYGMRLTLLLLLLLCAWAQAQSLTDAQYIILANDLLVTNQAEFAADAAARNDQIIADKYNAPSSPAYFVWKTNVTAHELYTVTTPQGTTWSWVAFGNQPVQQQSSWTEMRTGNDNIFNFALAQTQKAVNDIFAGAGLNPAQRTHCFNVGTRQASRVEKLLATGNGAFATPSTMGFEGKITYFDISQILNGIKGH